jgi:hypothetical protein
MTRVIVDAELLGRLGNLSELVELCDDRGRVLAQVVPSPNLQDYDPTEPSMSEDELARREASGKWYSTEEVLQRLRNLP